MTTDKNLVSEAAMMSTMKAYKARGVSRSVCGWITGGLLVVLYAAQAVAAVFSGTVLDSRGMPVSGAHVSVNHGGSITALADGRFSIVAPRIAAGDIVVASSVGLLANQITLGATASTTDLSVTLASMPPEDPALRPSDPARCIQCHMEYGEAAGWGGRGGFTGSAHASAAGNQRVLDVFNGTASGHTTAAACTAVGGRFETVLVAGSRSVERCYVAPGFLGDINPQCGHAGQPRCDDTTAPAASRPTAFGDCAGCHAPGAAISRPEELDLNVAEVMGVAGGVTCAGCHRISEVLDPNLAGVLEGARMLLGADGRAPLALGPLDDSYSTAMQIGYSPLFTEGRHCAPCHQDTFHTPGAAARWNATGVGSEQTYQEWAESPYASGVRERTCQNCHMPSLADLGVRPLSPLLAEGGPNRTPAQMHTHNFDPLTSPASLAASLNVTVTATQSAGTVVIGASVENHGVGHSFPSGVTTRNALLVVTATLGGQTLASAGGEVLPLYAGHWGSGRVMSATGAQITVDTDVAARAVGMELRVWREAAGYRDYVGFGLLHGLTPEQKGLRRTESIGRYRITAVNARTVDVDTMGGALPDLAGASFAVGDDRHLAGAPGLGFSKVNVAADGTTNVPFWAATDILWDNRIVAGETQASEHRFVIPAGMRGDVRVTARLIYRGAFIGLSDQRGWGTEDRPAGEATTTLAVIAPPLDAGTPDVPIVTSDASVDAGRDVLEEGTTTPPRGCGCGVAGAAHRGLALLAVLVGLTCVRRRRSPPRR